MINNMEVKPLVAKKIAWLLFILFNFQVLFEKLFYFLSEQIMSSER